MFDHIPHSWLFFTASLFVEGLAVYAWRFRDTPGAMPYSIHKLAIAVLLLSLMMASLNAGLAGKIVWIKLYHTGTFIAALAWLAVALQMTGRSKWLNRRTIAGALAVLALALFALYSNERFGLFWSRIWAEGSDVRETDGPWGIAITLTGYLVLLAAMGLFVHRSARIRGRLRIQAAIMILSTCVTLTGHFLWRFGADPGLRQDLLAAAFIVSGLLDAFALFRLRMFDIMPVAQTVVTHIMGDGLVVMDGQGQIVGMNPAARRLIAVTGPDAGGGSSMKVFEPWPELIDLLRGADTKTIEVFMNRRYYSVLVAPLSGRGYGNIGRALVFHDVSAEKAAQELSIERQKAAAVRKERDRLGRELHDGRGQTLGFFNMQIEAARSWIAKGRLDKVEPLLAQLAEVTQGLSTDIRESIAGLKIAAFQEGFLRTLDDYLHWFGESCGIKTDLAVIDLKEGAIPPSSEVQLQRIIQEALTNVRKHAGAHQVHVVIRTEGSAVEITVEDDGPGFDVEKALAKTGCYGLHIMRERAAEIGADLSFDSGPKAGTTLKVRVPVKEGDQGRQ